MSSTPPSPNILSPANGTAFAETTQTVLLSWSAVPGAGVYNVRVHHLTEPDLRHPGNNCVLDRHYVCVNSLTQTSLRVSVKPGHA